MPVWGQVILGAAAIITALGVLWSKVFRPGMRAAAAAEVMLPLLQELTLVFRDTPYAFKVLDEIVAQFRTDSGSSLRDVVNRLEQSAEMAAINSEKSTLEGIRASELLKVGVEASRLLADQDRQQLQNLLLLLDRLTVRVDAVTAAGLRLEIDRQLTADLLAVRNQEVDAASSSVATDLIERQRQVDAASTGVAQDLAARERALSAREALLDARSKGVAISLAVREKEVAEGLTERERLVDEASSGVATDLTERQRQVDAASEAVAKDLEAREKALAVREALLDAASSGVAKDLAASQKRADAIGDGEPGAAADAASQTAEEEKG